MVGHALEWAIEGLAVPVTAYDWIALLMAKNSITLIW